jgi:putative ABC transport system permease protein
VIRLVIRGLLARKLRTILTSIAIVLGVAIVCGTFILTDQINSAFDSIFQTGNEKIDAVVSRQTLFDSSDAETPPLPESVVGQVRRSSRRRPTRRTSRSASPASPSPPASAPCP